MSKMNWRTLGVVVGCVLVGGALMVGALPAWGQNVPVPAGQQADGKAVLSGKVTDKAGKPVANANVELHGPDYQQAKTDAQGQYVFGTIRKGGQYRIGAEAQGFLPITYWQDGGSVLQLSPGSEAKRDLVMERGASIVVTVTDSAGEPITGASIGATSGARDYRGGMRSIMTDDSGTATVTVAPSKRPYIVSAFRDGFALAHTEAIVDSVENPVDVALAMEPGVTLKGVAMCKDGKPAAGYEIAATPDWWVGVSGFSSAKIDAQGSFSLRNLGPGVYKLSLHIPMGGGGGYMVQEVPVKITVPAAQQPVRVDLPVASLGTRVKLTGKVRIIGSRPDYLQVYASSTSGARDQQYSQVQFGRSLPKTDKGEVTEGTYTFEGIPEGTYQLQFQSPTTEHKTLDDVKAPGEAPVVEIKVVGKPHITGAVSDAATGKAIGQYSIRARKLQYLGAGPHYGHEPVWVQVADAGGKFDLDVTGAGVYQVQAMAEGYAAKWSDDIRIESPEVKTDVQVKLTAGGLLTGMITDASGKPVEGAKVSPFSVAGFPNRGLVEHFHPDTGAVKTDAAGRFTLVHLASGDEKIRIAHPDFAPRIVSGLKVSEGQTADAGTVKLTAGGAAEGVVYDENGKPAAGVTIQFRDEEGWRSQEEESSGRLGRATTDDDGKFRVEHLPEGRTYAMIENYWSRQGTVRRIIRPMDGKTTRIDFGGPNAVKGTVVGVNGPVASARVQLAGESYYANMTTMGSTDEAGRFTLYGPPPGKYSLYYSTDMNRGDWTWVHDVVISGKDEDLGELKVEGADLLVTLESEDSAMLEAVQYVSLEPQEGPMRPVGVQRDSATGKWRAKGLVAGKYRVSAATKTGSAFSMIVECDGKEKAATLRIPKASATLRIPKASATLNATLARTEGPVTEGIQVALIANEDMSAVTHVTSQGEQPKGAKLPPGTYRVLNYMTLKPYDEVPAISLAEGETKAVQITLPRQTAQKSVMVGVWSGDGVLVLNAGARVLDAEGKEVARPRRMGASGTFTLMPGKYRAVVDRPGKEAVTKEFEVTEKEPMVSVDVLLPE